MAWGQERERDILERAVAAEAEQSAKADALIDDRIGRRAIRSARLDGIDGFPLFRARVELRTERGAGAPSALTDRPQPACPHDG